MVSTPSSFDKYAEILSNRSRKRASSWSGMAVKTNVSAIARKFVVLQNNKDRAIRESTLLTLDIVKLQEVQGADLNYNPVGMVRGNEFNLIIRDRILFVDYDK